MGILVVPRSLLQSESGDADAKLNVGKRLYLTKQILYSTEVNMGKFENSQEESPIAEVIAPDIGIFVHNVLDTKDEPIPEGYKSFLDYWEKKSGQDCPSECQAIDPHLTEDGGVADCTALGGAHVRIDEEDCPDDYAWIVPLCSHCNNDNNTSSIYMPSGTIFIPIKMAKKHMTAGGN